MSAEPESIIGFAIARGIRENPDQAAAEMLKLMRVNASLEAQVFILKEKIREWAGPGGV